MASGENPVLSDKPTGAGLGAAGDATGRRLDEVICHVMVWERIATQSVWFSSTMNLAPNSLSYAFSWRDAGVE